MPSRADDSFLLVPAGVARAVLTFMCQCPLGLMTHFYCKRALIARWRNYVVSMPSRADDSFLQYPFKNLGFMRFPEPVFAGICQNILTEPYFHACLQFGHI